MLCQVTKGRAYRVSAQRRNLVYHDLRKVPQAVCQGGIYADPDHGCVHNDLGAPLKTGA